MDLEILKILIDRYYSGDISPDEFEVLLSAFKENICLPPELENERRMFLAIESCAPVAPDELGKKLAEAIDRRQKPVVKIIKNFIVGSSAAAILIGMLLVGIRYSHPEHPQKNYMAETLITGKTTGAIQTIADSTKTTSPKIAIAESVTTESALICKKSISSANINDENLDIAARGVNEALMNVIEGINISRNDIADCMENIQINRKTDLNIF